MNEARHRKIEEKIPEIVSKIKYNKINHGFPGKPDRIKINRVILDHIRENKRVVKGGKAHDFWLSKKGKKLYEEDFYGDYDFLSTDPIFDITVICNKLYDLGYDDVFGTQGVRENVFTIKIYSETFCDIGFISQEVLKNHISYTTEDDIRYLDYKYLVFDMYFILSEPLDEYELYVPKTIKKLFLFEKYYPDIFQTKMKKLTTERKSDYDILEMKEKLFRNYLINNKNILISGNEAYNYYQDLSKYSKKYFKPDQSEEFVIVVKNLKEETKNVINFLGKNNTSIEEYYSYIFKLDRSVLLKYKGNNLIRIYGSRQVCIQYNTIELDNSRDTIQIVSYNYLMGYLNCLAMFYNKKSSMRDKFFTMFHYLNSFRNEYLNTNKLIGYEEDNPFNYFQPDCLWEKRSQFLIRMLYFNERFKQGKPRKFEYRPANRYQKEIQIKFPYLNNSGELIKDERHKIIR